MMLMTMALATTALWETSPVTLSSDDHLDAQRSAGSAGDPPWDSSCVAQHGAWMEVKAFDGFDDDHKQLWGMGP